VPIDHPQVFETLKERIHNARVRAHLPANRELIQLYWDLGRIIVERQEAEEWGESVIERLSTDLAGEFPEMKGLSPSNLWRMRSFYRAYSQLAEVLAQPARESEEQATNQRDLAQPVREFLQKAVANFEGGGDNINRTKAPDQLPEVLFA